MNLQQTYNKSKIDEIENKLDYLSFYTHKHMSNLYFTIELNTKSECEFINNLPCNLTEKWMLKILQEEFEELSISKNGNWQFIYDNNSILDSIEVAFRIN